MPENIVLLHLPPYSPELNPVENIWQYLRQSIEKILPRVARVRPSAAIVAAYSTRMDL